MNKDAATTQANLNRIDQETPQGSLKYTINGTNPDGTPRYLQTQTFSDAEQRKYDQNNQVATALNDTAISNIGRVQQAQATPFTYDGMTALRTSAGGNTADAIQTGPSGRQFQTGVAGAGTAQGIDPGLAGQGTQGSLDYSGLTKLPGTSDFGAEGQRMSNAVYGQVASRLDPRFAQSDSDLTSKLAAQGITNNSDAYRREMDNASRDRNDAYNQAAFQAQSAGANEQSRLFGLSMGARQQGQNEVNTQGGFVNDAQGQTYGQKIAAQSANADVQGQNFGQGVNNADMYNNAQTNEFGQAQSAAGFYNNAQNQWFNQDAANVQVNNAARQQQIQESAYLRNLPLNDIAALLNGNQPNSPTFNNVAQVGVAAPDYQGMVQSNYQTAVKQQQAQQAARSQMLGQVFGTVGSAVAMSDRRMKENIKRIGTLANGLATYAFNYIGNTAQQFGVMAQEVMDIVPDAVILRDNGIMYVNYGKVY